MDISETVSDASGVASQVASFLSPVKYTQTSEKDAEFSHQDEIVKVIPAALIIGGGISGLTAALNIANQGYTSYIIEKEKELGGNLRHISVLYPVQVKASKFLRDIREKVENNTNIKVFLNSTIEVVSGSIGNYVVFIRNSGEKHR